ncbi:MAG: divergent polysaccharide deacetylase family protein [Candidatus Omnitrophica bacterium]|nr:divergent polysaccharide deacetylase family protein [Candidatus Omnitrophota bacterium]
MTKRKINFIITISLIALLAMGMSVLKKADYSEITADCDQKIAQALQAKGIDPNIPLTEKKQLLRAFRKQTLAWEKTFNIPYSLSMADLKKSLTNDIDFLPAKIRSIKKTKTSKENIITLELEYQQFRIYCLILKQKHIQGKIALVLDDWGYSESLLNPALALKTPITYAILPNLAHSLKIAKALNANGDELILHLPLEPHNADKHALEKNTILTSMDKREIIDIALKDMNSLPNLKGVNNHMGSKATEDANVMGIIFDIIKEKKLYFLDSYTSRQSALSNVAEQKNIVFFKRDIFIDDTNDKENIKQQMIKTRDIAKRSGTAIAIGHAKALTIETLKEMIPFLEEQGFKFVYLSELNSEQESE